MKPCLLIATRSLLSYHGNPFFKVSKGDYYAELFPESIIGNNGKHSCALPVAGTITKYDTSGESITMDIKIFACVSHVHSFGKHMSVDSTGGHFFVHKLAEDTVLASLQFDPGGYLPGGFVFDPRGFMRLLK